MIAGDLVVHRRSPRRAYRLQSLDAERCVVEALDGSCTISLRPADVRAAEEIDLSDAEVAEFAGSEIHLPQVRLANEVERRRALARDVPATPRRDSLALEVACKLATTLVAMAAEIRRGVPPGAAEHVAAERWDRAAAAIARAARETLAPTPLERRAAEVARRSHGDLTPHEQEMIAAALRSLVARLDAPGPLEGAGGEPT